MFETINITQVLINAEKAFYAMDSQNDINRLLIAIKDTIRNNEDIIKSTNSIDASKGGDKLPFDAVISDCEYLAKTEEKYKQVIEMGKTEDGFIIGRHFEPIGILGVIYDGNPYVTMNLALKAIKTRNAVIFNTNNSNLATNNILIMLLQKVLKRNGYPEHLIQLFNSETNKELLDSFATINKNIVIGDSKKQNEVRKESSIEVICSGHGNYEIYIDDAVHIEFIKKVINQGIDVKVFVKEGLKVPFEVHDEVEDIDVAIQQINIHGSKYSSSIFTSSPEIASKFIKQIKSKHIFVNASPTLAKEFDIHDEELLYTKSIFYPNKYDGELNLNKNV